MAEPLHAPQAPRELYGLVAEFDDVASVTRAARAVRDAGYKRFDVYSPFPIHGIERAMGLKATHLPWIVLTLGLTGMSIALLLQWWTNAVAYPFKISGKPLFGLPAGIPITFELTVLLAAFGAFFGMLILNRLPEHHHPLFELKRFARATDDGFFLAIEAADANFEAAATHRLLQALTPLSVMECHDSGQSGRAPNWVRSAGLAVAALALVPFAAFAASRWTSSSSAPFHLVKDMDSQPRYRAQAANAHFDDGRAMRPQVEGSVAADAPTMDATVSTGRSGADWSPSIPLQVTATSMQRGRERFAIYCAPCHGQAGYGDGLVAARALELQETNWVPPASLHDPMVRARPAGQIFDTIRNGVRTMPAYGRQIPIEDMWAIVAYVRALQRSQHASEADVPEAERAKLGAQ